MKNSEPRAMQQIRSVAVIMPIFNERRSVGATVRAVGIFAQQNPRYRFLFVDDGSGDGTDEALREAIRLQNVGNITSFHCDRNRGKWAAIRTGAGQVEADALCILDADLAYSLDHLPLIEEALGSSDVAIGSRRLTPSRLRPSLRRHIMGEAFNRLVRLILGLPYRDTQAGIKGFRLQAARRLFGKSGIEGFGCDAEILFLAKKYGMRVTEIPAHVSDDHFYKKGKLKLIRDSAIMFSELLLIRLKDLSGRYD